MWAIAVDIGESCARGTGPVALSAAPGANARARKREDTGR